MVACKNDRIPAACMERVPVEDSTPGVGGWHERWAPTDLDNPLEQQAEAPEQVRESQAEAECRQRRLHFAVCSSKWNEGVEEVWHAAASTGSETCAYRVGGRDV